MASAAITAVSARATSIAMAQLPATPRGTSYRPPSLHDADIAGYRYILISRVVAHTTLHKYLRYATARQKDSARHRHQSHLSPRYFRALLITDSRALASEGR